MIGVPRVLLIGLAAIFSGYHIVLGIYSLGLGFQSSNGPVVAALLLYAAGTVAALVPPGSGRLPIWLAAFALGVAVSLPLLVSSVLDPRQPGVVGTSTWYVAAVGTLLTILAARRQPGLAWAGLGVLAVHTVVWAGPVALFDLGVVGDVSWVAVAHILTNTLVKAARDSTRFAVAEREAAAWQAAQEAHVNERQFRLAQTSAMALSMLRTIQRSGGELTPAQRAECLHLESAIRDEIRGRKLLSDPVREQVMLARRRGTLVTLLDEGGLDELDDAELAWVHGRLADALREVAADKVIVRTVPEGSEVAVTVVGLRSSESDDPRGMGGDADDDAEVALWLEIPRTVSA